MSTRSGATEPPQKREILQLARDYEGDRLRYRNAMLAAQDELRAAVPADVWPDVLEVLSRKGSALVPRRARQG